MEYNKRVHEDSFWYENSKKGLLNQIKWCYDHEYGPNNYSFDNLAIENPLGIITPHAGFSCSGPYAAVAFEALKQKTNLPDSVIVLGPNHTGLGPGLSIFPSPGMWETPLGNISIDEQLSEELSSKINENPNLSLEYDTKAHVTEHSIDNQLPFLQNVFPKSSIVPICIMDQRYKTCLELGSVVADIIRKNESKKKILLVASSDFSHFIEHQEAFNRDNKVIKELMEMKLEAAEHVKNQENVSACGFGPIITLFSAAQSLGKSKAEKLIYGSSGLTCSSKVQVVGYGAIIV
ncbi:MAG: AmmeMemoRadiSam system protein B [Candidatus Hodarchaeales archaeon]|jgi:AmmeMemoRadiSam system protein B